MPGEVIGFIILLVVIVFIFAGLAIKWDHNFKLKKEELRAGGKGSSLGTSELRGMIQEAMLDTIVPLEERLERMESHLRRLPEHGPERGKLELEEPDGDPDEHAGGSGTRRRQLSGQ